MTNRRRSGKSKAAVSKKADSPDKHTRKLSRRGRRSKKSESPERPEEAGSECSGDEVEDSNNKSIDGEANDNSKEENQIENNKSNEDAKSQVKEEESGGSDGSWKVKSENGGGGGIPKLKLCLTRPPEMPSPTSTTDQNPSPRRKRRCGRGNATPTKEEELLEENVVEECSKRITRHKTREMQESEVEQENLQEESEQRFEEEVSNSTNVVYSEEDETRIAVESICIVEPKEESQSSMIECIQQETYVEEESKDDSTFSEQNETPVTENFAMSVENIPEPSVEKIPEPSVQNTVKPSVDSIPEPLVESTIVENIPIPVETNIKNIPEPEEEKKENIDSKKSEVESKEVENVDLKVEEESVKQTEDQAQNQIEEKLESEQEIKGSVIDNRRSSSRDSSEERAKEAALRSRNKCKKKDESDDFDAAKDSGGESVQNAELEDKTKTSSPAASDANQNDRKHSIEEPAPTKSGARKRRWGSSTSKAGKKPSVSISTDFLKEIIPEAKPLLLSEVQLSPNDEDEEGQLKDSEENLPVVTKKVEVEKMMQSDESEKDYEEEAVESGMEEPSQTESVKPTLQVKEKEFSTFTRKVSVMPSNEKMQKSPSPPRHKPSNILYIVNLVRPFTIPQLRELLARTGTITEDGFWIDKIKSKCYVKYETEEQAKITRHALHGVRWPISNPKQLNVDFGTEAAMKAAIEGNEITTKRPIPSLFDKQIELKSSEKTREREREKDKSGERRDRNEKDKRDRGKHREDEKREEEGEKEKKTRPLVEPLVRDRTVRRVTVPIREWDLGKNEDGFSPPLDGMEYSRHRDDRYERRVEYDRDKRDDYDDRRRRDKDRSRRSVSGEPARKSKKKSEEEAPAKLLDDLFRKTKATPCIYWLPLTPEQISVKEEMRRKHMAEHEKKVAELRKMQREQSKRNIDKRRRRTKSRSRSRSPKK